MRFLTLGGKMLTHPLRMHGHEVAALGAPGTAQHPLDRETDFFTAPESARETVRSLAEAFRPDWILQVDDSLPLPHLGLENLPFRKAWWAVDSHLHWEWHRHYAPLFQSVLGAQQNRLKALGEHRNGVEWLPISFRDTPEFLPWDLREHDVSFVGTLDPSLNPARIRLLERLASLGQPVRAVQGLCKPVYRVSRIVINQAAGDDLNARFFEAMGHGALLITDRLTHSMDDIAEPGRDFLTYEPGDAEDLRAKIRWALGHPEAAEAMARRGNAKVAARHLLGDRVRRLIELLAAADPCDPPRGRMLAHLAAAHEHLSRLALPGPLVAFFASEARRHALAALEASPAEPYALLALAQLDLEKGAHAEALRWLDAYGGGEYGEGYRRRYAFLRALLTAHTGRLPEARRAVLAGLEAFPGDDDLARLRAALGA